ncbi:MAG: hypothetical protein IJ213_03645 [Bacteroidales bacterium]|nr:hypothetical protein [Bacteroidales bacterium]
MSWQDLTEREKALDRAIEQCGIRLDLSEKCENKVMQLIGAREEERLFIRECIALRISMQQLLDKTDNFIDETERMLDSFKKDNERWKSLGRKLGFNF